MSEDILKEKLKNEFLEILYDTDFASMSVCTEESLHGLAWDLANSVLEKYELEEKQLSLFEGP